MATKESICSQSLVLLGAQAISSFSDPVDNAAICSTLYEQTINALLSEYPWRFTMTKRQLSRLTTAPVANWSYAFQIPAELIGAPFAVYRSDSVNEPPFKWWNRYEDQILSNELELWIDENERVSETGWPAYFTQLAVFEMAAMLAMPVTDSQTKASYWRAIARGTPEENGKGGYFQVATNADAKGNPPQQIQDFTLINARMGGMNGFRG